MPNVAYAVPGGPWKKTDNVITAINLRIRKLDPSCPWSRSGAFQVRFAREAVERPEADSIEVVLGLFAARKQSHHLPLYRPGGTAEDVLWLQRFLERLKPDASSLVWTLQEQSRVPPHGAFLFMVRLAGMAAPEPGERLPEGKLMRRPEAIDYSPLAAYAGDDEKRHRFIVCSGVCAKQVGGAGGAVALKNAQRAWDDFAHVREYEDAEGQPRYPVRFFDGTCADAYQLAIGPPETLLAEGMTYAQLRVPRPLWPDKAASMPTRTRAEEDSFLARGVFLLPSGAALALSWQLYWESHEIAKSYCADEMSCLHYDLLCRSETAVQKARETGEPTVLSKVGNNAEYPDVMLAFPSGLKATVIAGTRSRYSTKNSGEATACRLLLGDRACEIVPDIEMCTLSECPCFAVVESTNDRGVFLTPRVGLEPYQSMKSCLFVVSPAAETSEVRANGVKADVRCTYTARMRERARKQEYRQFPQVSEEEMGRRIDGSLAELRAFLAEKKERIDSLVEEASQVRGGRSTSRRHLGDLHARLMGTSEIASLRAPKRARTVRGRPEPPSRSNGPTVPRDDSARVPADQ